MYTIKTHKFDDPIFKQGGSMNELKKLLRTVKHAKLNRYVRENSHLTRKAATAEFKIRWDMKASQDMTLLRGELEN
jgi:hypothetical protein